jgi:uncharacterized protein (TIGR00661 family)
MKIILGVCGFGLGHSTRQRPIFEGLTARGHEIIVIANDASHQYFARHFPDARLYRVYVPAMTVTSDGLDFTATANDPRNADPAITRSFWDACAYIEKEFRAPDLVISDYDMVSAQIAYLFGAPLVTLDQQHKFLGYDFPPVNGYTPQEHRMRLGYFFPKARARIATSFFRVDYAALPDYAVTIVPPIIGWDLKGKGARPIDGQVTVYISTASAIQQSFRELAGVFAAFPDYTFQCFAEGSIAIDSLPSNIRLMPNTRAEFLACLCQSSAVIATAGHNLITEALYLRVPMFLIPFQHYEQQLNAHIIAREQLGYANEVIDPANLRQFFANLDAYRDGDSDRIYRRYDGDTVVLEMIEALILPLSSSV